MLVTILDNKTIKPTLCKVCKEIKDRIFNGYYNPLDKRWVDINKDLWNGRVCPPCNAIRIMKAMKKMRTSNSYIRYKDKDYSAKNKNKQKRSKLELSIQVTLNNQFNHHFGKIKLVHPIKDLGCSIKEIMVYLESKFILGMTWETYGKGIGKWNIDHIYPLSKVDKDNRKHLLKVCHYTNLQPLWMIDNIKKGNKIPNGIKL